MYKRNVRSFPVLALLVGLAACSSGIQTDTPSIIEEPSLSTQATTVSYRVSNSVSDAEEKAMVTGYGSPVLELGEKGPNDPQTVGLRFTGVNVPEGATITSAYIEFNAVIDTSGSSSLTIYGIGASDTPDFSGSNSTISARPKTSAKVSWAPGSWIKGNAYRSDSLISIVKEITSRSDWAADKTIGFSISGTGTRKASSYDGNSANAPKLVVTYGPPETTNPNCYTTGTYKSTIVEQPRTFTTTYRYRGLRQSTRIDASKLTVQLKNNVGTGFERALILSNNAADSICLRGGTYNPNVPEGAEWEPDFHTDVSIYMENSPNTTIENVAIYRGADAFTLKDKNNNTTIRDSYIYRAGDDVIENDRKNANMVVDDILADSAYTGFSCQHEAPFTGTRVEWTIKNSLIALRRENNAANSQKPIKLWKFNKGKYPTAEPANKEQDIPAKDYGKTNCRITFQDNVILITRPNRDLVIDPGTYKLIKTPGNAEYVSDSPMHYEACNGHQNIIVYTGPTDKEPGKGYYKQLQDEVNRHRECFKLETNYNVWKNARTAWFSRHPNFTAKYGDETGKFINSETK